MYAIINRNAMLLVGRVKYNVTSLPPLHQCLDLDDPECFRQYTSLEMKLLYNNLGAVRGVNMQDRASVENGVRVLLNHHPVRDLNQQPLFGAAPQAPQAPTGDAAPAASTSTPPAAAPRLSGVRDAIWSHADKVWESEGKPADKKIVLQLRKRMMDELERDGYKRTSVSNELGNWMKSRVPG